MRWLVLVCISLCLLCVSSVCVGNEDITYKGGDNVIQIEKGKKLIYRDDCYGRADGKKYYFVLLEEDK